MLADLDRGHFAALAMSALGIWLMAAPAVLDYGSPMSTSDRIVGPSLISIGGVAIWEVSRGFRRAALPFCLWLLISPWLLDAPLDATVSSMVVGIAAAALSFVEGDVPDEFGGGWRAVWQSESPYKYTDGHDRESS